MTDELIKSHVFPKRLSDPVVQRPHALLAQLVAGVTNEVGPFQRPIRCVSIVVDVHVGVAGETK